MSELVADATFFQSADRTESLQAQNIGQETVFACLTASQARTKRLCDLCIAPCLLLLLLLPMVLITLLIRLTTPGPAIFRQPRTGQFNKLFTCYKFRTMHREDSDVLADKQTIPNDARITPVGRWLRRLSLDELPQLINVIKGDMSLVGPRPHAPLTKADGWLFGEIVPNYNARHGVRPGITGLAQISGCRGQTKTREDVIKRVELDLLYIRDWSIWLDVKTMYITFVNEIYSDHAF